MQAQTLVLGVDLCVAQARGLPSAPCCVLLMLLASAGESKVPKQSHQCPALSRVSCGTAGIGRAGLVWALPDQGDLESRGCSLPSAEEEEEAGW